MACNFAFTKSEKKKKVEMKEDEEKMVTVNENKKARGELSCLDITSS